VAFGCRAGIPKKTVQRNTDISPGVDLSQVIHPVQPLDSILAHCHNTYVNSMQRKWAFSISSKTVLPFLTPEQQVCAHASLCATQVVRPLSLDRVKSVFSTMRKAGTLLV
jgi:hypothetical protein